MAQLLLIACILLAAILFSSVGNAGASGYLAAMALFGLPANEMRAAALVLNIIAAAITTMRFYRAGCINWSVFWPFAVSSIPLSFIGGLLHVEPALFRALAGCALLIASYSLIMRPAITSVNPPSPRVAIGWGAAIGLLSGITGTGGGVFLSPLLLTMGWANARETAGVSSASVLVNSLASTIGLQSTQLYFPSQMYVWSLAVVAGASIGSALGSRFLGSRALSRILAVVLLIASLKLLAT